MKLTTNKTTNEVTLVLTPSEFQGMCQIVEMDYKSMDHDDWEKQEALDFFDAYEDVIGTPHNPKHDTEE